MWRRVYSSQGNLEFPLFSSYYTQPYIVTNRCPKPVSMASLQLKNRKVPGLYVTCASVVDRRSMGLGILLSNLFAKDIFDSKAVAADSSGDRKAHWSYEFEGQDWTGDCSRGRDQSPIDISNPHNRAVVDDKAFKISYPKVIDGCTIENNGHGSPQINMPRALNSSQSESLLFPSVSLNGHSYNLVQVHFHCPSEHSFEGYHGDVEAHFVHADDKGRFLVLAIIMQSNGGKAKLAALSKLLQTALEQVPDSPGRADKLVKTTIKLHEMIMDGSNQHYYNYKGSLTTPPCSEPVEWIVRAEPQNVSADSVLRLQRLSSSGKTLNFNARRIQSSKGRLVREL